MQKPRKRKRTQAKQPSSLIKSTGTDESKTAVVSSPYPSHRHPTPEECRFVIDDLLALDGFPAQFVKYRKLRPQLSSIVLNQSSDDVDSPEESVLDGLVSTLLSQNTTEANSHKAFASLKSAFLTWNDVLNAESKSIENAIRCGGLAVTKAASIKNILTSLHDKKGKLCLEYLRNLSIDQVKAELSQFKGIGPKTVACVLMFHLQHDDFPVDTHIFQIAKSIGWVPAIADTKKTYAHLNQRIPNELKFDLNCLLYTHGKLCRKCIAKVGDKQNRESIESTCPLLKYFYDRSLTKSHEVHLRIPTFRNTVPKITTPFQSRSFQHDFVPSAKPILYKYPAFYDPYGPTPPPSGKIFQLAQKIAALAAPQVRKQIGPALQVKLRHPEKISTQDMDHSSSED